MLNIEKNKAGVGLGTDWILRLMNDSFPTILITQLVASCILITYQ